MLRLVGLLILLACHAASAAEILHARMDRLDRTYEVHADSSFVETTDVDFVLFTPRGIHERERSSRSFTPGTQDLEVLEAWVDQPDGTRLTVGAEGRFTRPSDATQNAPGFSNSLTTTVLFPQLRPGSRTHVRWRMTQKTPPLFGFNAWAEPPMEFAVGVGQVTILTPWDLPLNWRARGGFEVTDQHIGDKRVVVARITGVPAEPPERDMVDTADFRPLFLATTLARPEELGARYWQHSHGKVVVTPQISALATRIAGGKGTDAAARAVYAWVAGNIRYVAVYLDANDDWVPHDSASVLRAGYGDCKDHVVLMQALLASLGIEADAALVDWGDRTQAPPLFLPQVFNHAIVYLPALDRFVNPTNPYARFDSLDGGLAGKPVAIATPDGRLTQTPPARPDANAYRMDSTLALSADGTISGAARFTMSPNEESGARAMVAQAGSPEELGERLLAGAPEGGFGTLRASDPRDLDHPLDVVATWRSPHAAVFHGEEAVLPIPTGPDLDPVSRLRRLLSDGSRRHPLLAGVRDDRWSVRLMLPRGVSVARLPDDVSLRNGAGSYTATYTREASGILAERRLVIEHDLFQPEETAALQELLYAPLDDSRSVVVLTRAQNVAAMAPPATAAER